MTHEQATGRCTLYFLCGLPFSGKSTLVQALTAFGSYQVVSYDAINRERTRELGGAQIPADDWILTEAEARRQVIVQLTAGQSVIYDHVNFLQSQRQELRALAAHHGATIKVIWVDVPADVATARWQHNRMTGLRFDVRDEDFALVLSMFEPPTADEAPLRYTGTLPLDAWVSAHFTSQH